MKRLVRPVLCFGIASAKQIIPFMCVDYYDFRRRTKRVLVNYTFGQLEAGKTFSPDMLSPLGRAKLAELQSLEMTNDTQLVYVVEKDSARPLSVRLAELIEEAGDGDRILFVIEPKKDEEFYKALSMDSPATYYESPDVGEAILSERELGIKMNLPFTEINLKG